jgi:hypothetical protein
MEFAGGACEINGQINNSLGVTGTAAGKRFEQEGTEANLLCCPCLLGWHTLNKTSFVGRFRQSQSSILVYFNPGRRISRESF